MSLVSRRGVHPPVPETADTLTPFGRLTPSDTLTGAPVALVAVATRPALAPTATVDGVMLSPATTGVPAAAPATPTRPAPINGAAASRPSARRYRVGVRSLMATPLPQG